ncbi:MAG: thiamine diphosphokinase [Ruminococcaceae bacterium]|nr:thiamine diphosphokinase [Oscillospiraceae bacterium]
MSRCVIIGGADIYNYDRMKSYLTSEDFYIFCDSGLKHLSSLGVKADLIVGDFDSHPKPDTEGEMIVLPREKDDTDTMFAVKEGIKRGFEEFLLLGVVGGRLDHTLGNVSALLYLNSRGKKAALVDDYSEITVVAQEEEFVKDSFQYFSLLNISGVARGIMVENAKYPLKDAEITCEYPYGISNEAERGKRAKVLVKEGRLLLVKVF